MDFTTALNGPQAGAQPEIPDMMAPPATTPEEVAQRKLGWKSVLDEINTNPALQQAMLVTGFQLMRPGSNLGEAGLAGVATYADAQQQQAAQSRQQGQDARAERKDQREEQLLDMRLKQSQADIDWMEKKRPLELQKMQGEIDLLPGEAEKQSLSLQLKRVELQQAPEMAKLELARLRAQIAASNRSGAAAFKATDQERAISALEQSSEFKDLPPLDRRAAATREFYTGLRAAPRSLTDQERAIQGLMSTSELQALPEAERRAAATNKFYSENKSAGAQIKRTDAEQRAMALAAEVEANPSVYALQMLDTDFAQVVAFGKRLNETAPQQSTATPAVSAATAAQPSRRVIDAATIRKQLEEKAAGK